ncbi:MAG: hypothetical protein ACI9QV_000771 [Methylophagaceae bacterium]|jgi:uncharacterized protein (DUF2062 family)
MPRRFLRRIMPDHRVMREHPHLQRFGQRLAEPRLWHLNRRSIAFGLAVGLFVAFMPILGQMFVAAALAILVRVNLPIAVMAVWVTNPVTIAPIYFFSYRLGAYILELPVREQAFTMSWEWFATEFVDIWQPLLLGSFLLGISAALLAILLVRVLWRFLVVRSWARRRQNKKPTD